MCSSPLWAAEMEVSSFDHIFHSRRRKSSCSPFIKTNASTICRFTPIGLCHVLLWESRARDRSRRRAFHRFPQRSKRTSPPCILSYQVPA